MKWSYGAAALLIVLLSTAADLRSESANNDGIPASSGGYVEVDGVRLYYEMSGRGAPVLYLHGGLSSGRDFSRYIPELGTEFQVITVDRKGHGRSYDDDKQYSYSSMAESMNLFLEHLGIDSVFVIGWSDGGVVGFHLAAEYPDKVKKLIAVGANYLVDGMTESSIEWIKTQLTAANISRSFPLIESDYMQYNPDPGNFPGFIDRTREMWLRDPYIPKEDLVKINIPVLLVAGDRDDIRLEHMIEMHSLMKTSELCILPNTTHFVFEKNSRVVTELLIGFLQK